MLPPHNVRKYVVMTETVHHDYGPQPDKPILKGVCAAVLVNPFAGQYQADLMPWMESLRPLSVELSQRLLAAMQLQPHQVRSFGKGALVGVEGELEHAAAWHAPGGGGMKSVLNVRGFVSAGEGMGAVGTSLHIPMVHVEQPWVRSHFDSIALAIADAPRPREIVFAVAMGTGGRIHQRLGGFTAAQADAGEVPKL